LPDEKTSLVTIADHATLNAGSTVQAHSLEDGAFKSDYIVLGPGVTLGPYAFVHYGVTMHEGAVLDADSFLMKGQDARPRTRWQGNPAAETATVDVSAESPLVMSQRPG
jgi:non-ribosomal peptide synthetase-like protein